MRKMAMGCGILLAFLVLGVVFSILMPKFHEPVGQMLREAADAAFRGDWEGAEDFFFGAKERWERFETLTAMVSDHTPQEEMKAQLMQAEGYLYDRSREFSPLCRKLAVLAESISELHSIGWKDVF